MQHLHCFIVLDLAGRRKMGHAPGSGGIAGPLKFVYNERAVEDTLTSRSGDRMPAQEVFP
jgi:hypothetical protein